MYSLYISKSNTNEKYICPINMDCINLTKLILIRPYNLYNFINFTENIELENKIKIKDTIIFGYKKNINNYLERENNKDILLLYDLFIMKYDIDNDDIIGFDKNEIEYIFKFKNN
jgi:hypothetical protein